MKMLLSTTAMVVALALPMATFAQSSATPTNPAGQGQTDRAGAMGGNAFLSERGRADLLASELMGHAVHVRRATTGSAGVDQTGMTTSRGTREIAVIDRARLDGMDSIGQISDIVFSHDGEMQALVIGVGGFLGMGERDVAVGMNRVSFARAGDNSGEMLVIVDIAADTLGTAPAYDRSAVAGAATGTAGDARFTAPQVTRDGYERVAATEVSSEMLVGQSVYGMNDRSVGRIENLILSDQGAITAVIIDFGGFLGMGTSQVSVDYDELTVLTDGRRSNVRVYIDATREQVQARPLYVPVN
jgi:sporulation protein YlmC with PRC-barrel domain